LLRLPDAIKSKLLSQEISEGHARALLTLESEELQLAALQVVLQKALSVRQTEELVRALLQKKAASRPEPQAAALSPEERALENDFRRVLGTKVNLVRSKTGGGRLIIEFYSEEELKSIYELINKSGRV
jgi:ParB family chromosome partitioning protein